MENLNNKHVPILLKLMGIGAFFLMALGLIIIQGVFGSLFFNLFGITGFSSVEGMIGILNKNPNGRMIANIAQGMSQLFTFILFPILFMKYLNKENLKMRITLQEFPKYFTLAFFTFLTFIPILALIVEWNQHINLPSYFDNIEADLKSKEDALAKFTDYIVYYSNAFEYLIGILVVSIIPGIGEELVFRGIIQQRSGGRDSSGSSENAEDDRRNCQKMYVACYC